MTSNKPKIIDGGSHIDDRGVMGFINDITFFDFKRMYTIENFENKFVRAWHGHKLESKIIFCVSGAFKIGAVKIDDFTKPSKNEKPYEFIVSSIKPSLLFIPEGFANGLMNLESNSKLIIFSNKTLEESSKDDYRIDSNYWNIWKIHNR